MPTHNKRPGVQPVAMDFFSLGTLLMAPSSRVLSTAIIEWHIKLLQLFG